MGAVSYTHLDVYKRQAKSFAKAGGIGIAPEVYNAMLKEQGLKAS